MSNSKLREMILVALFTALIGVMGYVSIPLPISPVPITGQTFAIMLLGLILTPKQAFMSVGTFILLGVVGVPVFSNGRAGVSVLVGTNGGYIVGFLVGAVAISLLKGREISLPRMIFAAAAGGVLIVYLLGVPWLAYIADWPLSAAILKGAVPFLIGDTLKVILSAITAQRLRKILKS